eukprot:m.335673 g.335673  ORF g.335673 m.335673 type:complete len:1187 (+) comp17648_c0_seq1:145-3705(+)
MGDSGMKIIVEEEDGQQTAPVTDSSLLYEEQPQHASGNVDDLAQLVNLTEQTLLDELKVRYSRDVIYTFVSDILIAVNPFKPLPIYTDQVASKYQDIVPAFVPPHVWVVADQSYHNLNKMKKDQCIVISGESGAGKTESAKKVVQHIIRLTRSKRENESDQDDTQNEVLSGLEDRIIKCSPVLEAFGNAQTVMNDNSSRFGKYTRLLFSETGSVMGVQISTYLLEKSRVMEQDEGERNFHVFYYLFALAAIKEKFSLSDVKDFTALTGEIWDDNQAMTDELVESLGLVGFTKEEDDMLFAVLSAVLHLSNILFEDDDGKAKLKEGMKGEEALKLSAGFLGVDGATLTKVMLSNENVTRGETIIRPYTVAQSYDCRDALAKALYGSVFGWIVGRTNEMLAPELHQKKLAGGRPGKAMSQKPANEIGVLDIFGFENFETNSFEQMCINLAHEQLQYFFNRHTFKIELEEYEKEGIDVKKITFRDNLPLIDMFLGRPIGILALLDEESSFPKATDKSLVDKIEEQFASNSFYKKPPAAKGFPSFGIQHFAGHVEYNATNFLDKNRDNLAGGIVDVLGESSVSLVQDVFLGEITPEGEIKLRERNTRTHRGEEQAKTEESANKVHRKSPTLSAQFKQSLKTLIDRMTACYPHFIRCIKPNFHQRKEEFVDDFVMTQLRYTGVLEATRIRQEGFSWRPAFADFVQRYKIIAFDTVNLSRVKNGMGSATKIIEAAKLENYHIGKTKLFLKFYHLEQLERSLQKYFSDVTRTQAAVRGVLARKKYKKLVARKAMAEAQRAEQDRIEAEEAAAREAAKEAERQKKAELLKMESEIADKELTKAEEERRAAEMRVAEANALAEVRAMEAKIAEEKARLAQAAQQEAFEALEKAAEEARIERQKAEEEALRIKRERAVSKVVRKQQADEEAKKTEAFLEQQKKEHEEALKEREALSNKLASEKKELEDKEKELLEKLNKTEEEARKLREEAAKKAEEAAKEREEELKALEEETKREAEEARKKDYSREDYSLVDRIKELLPEAEETNDLEVTEKKLGGYVIKLGGSVVPNWNKRWLSIDLQEETVKYYTTNKSKKEKNSIPMDLIIRCFKPENPVKKHAKHPNMFMIETPERTFFCRAPSPEAQNMWVAAINDFVGHIQDKKSADGAEAVVDADETKKEEKTEEKSEKAEEKADDA